MRKCGSVDRSAEKCGKVPHFFSWPTSRSGELRSPHFSALDVRRSYGSPLLLVRPEPAAGGGV